MAKNGAEKAATDYTVQKVTKGRGGNSNFPVAASNYDMSDTDLVKRMLSETINAYKQERVKNDDELAERLSNYFQMCAETGQRPSIEEMAMTTGYSLSTVWDWENGRNRGFSPRTSELIKKGKDFMKVFDAKMVMENKLNPVTYFFRAKNYYGMRDVQDVVVTPNNPIGEVDETVVQKRITEGVIIEGETAD